MSDDIKKKFEELIAYSKEYFKDIDDLNKKAHDDWVAKNPEQATCNHGIYFDEDAFKQHGNMSAEEVRKRWPRGWGACPKGCGYTGIAYASYLHYIAGDW